ncbi:MAG: Tim44 domain-containing protein [Desulfobulbaceae bacterium]|nr:Tim44 domain-containing protein [Desulfobulbaceae bacterium]
MEAGITAEYADARSKGGGRSFKSSPTYKKAPAKTNQATATKKQSSGGFGRGLMGGLLGGAIGGMLFGSMFGAGGSGMGILPMLLLAGGAYFLYRKFSAAKRGQPGGAPFGQQNRQGQQSPQNMFGGGTQPPPPPTPDIGGNLLEEGLAQIRQSDRNFDDSYFTEIASDVFFQVQAGWMRRDIDSYRHLLGEQLAKEYEGHFEKMREKGTINKLESIAIRGIEIVQAGSDGSEDFVTVRFTANLLDYNVDDKTGELVDGSMTTPVKFDEEWSWARPTGTQDWKLEGIN